MPTYDYQCQVCGQTFEVRATITQKTAGLEPECPECHSKTTIQAFRSMMFIRSGDRAGPMPLGCDPDVGPGCC